MATTDVKLRLLSRAVTARPDGNYPYNEKALLIPHEGLRRELIFGQKALQNFNPIQHPWKALRFYSWMSEFVGPIIHGHHDLEEKVFFDFYIKLGASVPPKQSDDHKTLMATLDQILDISRRIWDLVSITNGQKKDEVQINTAVEELKTVYNTFYEHMDEHLNEEEAFWPPEIAKYGEKNNKKVEGLIVEWGRKNEGRHFENFAAAILYAMGEEINKVDRYPDDTYWAGPVTRAEMLAAFPYPVRALLIPGWNKRYQRFKTMIHSLNGDQDLIQLLDQQAGCACIIA